jgi:hypothetical protein
MDLELPAPRDWFLFLYFIFKNILILNVMLSKTLFVKSFAKTAKPINGTPITDVYNRY